MRKLAFISIIIMIIGVSWYNVKPTDVSRPITHHQDTQVATIDVAQKKTPQILATQ